MLKIPHVSLETWKKLYEEAVKFQMLQPWKFVGDHQIFAIQNPVDGEIGYCSILGCMGTFFALNIYRGREGLERLHRILNDNVIFGQELYIMEDLLQVDYCELSELQNEDLKVMKQIGFNNKSAPFVPTFRSCLKGFLPWYISEQEAHYLIFALKASSEMIKRFTNTPAILPPHPRTLYPLITPIKTNKDEKNLTWEVQLHDPGPFVKKELKPLTINLKRIKKILGLTLKSKEVWEIGMFSLPSRVLDRDRPYMPYTLCLVDQPSFYILNMTLLTPSESDLCDAFQTLILDAIEKDFFIPDELQFVDPFLCEALKPLGEYLKIKFSVVNNLPAMEDVKNGMDDHL